MNFDFSGVDAPKTEKEYYGLRLTDFIAPLVQAVKELSDRNDSLQAKVDRMEQQMKGSGSVNASLSDAQLGENTPNPFSSNTRISYTLPFKYGRAKMMITDMSGKVVRNVPVNGFGKSILNIDASSLSAGVYNYTLYIDNQIVSTRQMIKK